MVRCLPSKHKTFGYNLYDASSTSSTLVQHCINAIQMISYCLVRHPKDDIFSFRLHAMNFEQFEVCVSNFRLIF